MRKRWFFDNMPRRRGGGELFELFDELVAEAAEEGEGEHGAADDFGREVAENERCAAEAAELFAERLIAERVFLGFGAGLVGG